MSGRTTLYVIVVLADLGVTAGWATLGQWWGMAGLTLVAALWLIGELRRWRWSGHLGLFFLTILAAIGLELGMPAVWAILGVVLAMVAWEVSYFQRFLSSVSVIDHEEILVRIHRQRLLIVSVLGAALTGMAVTIQVSFSFGIALLLAVLALLGFGRAIQFLRQESQS